MGQNYGVKLQTINIASDKGPTERPTTPAATLVLKHFSNAIVFDQLHTPVEFNITWMGAKVQELGLSLVS